MASFRIQFLRVALCSQCGCSSLASSSSSSSSLIITSQARAHEVQFTPSFDFFPWRRTRSLDFVPDWDSVKSSSCPKATIKTGEGNTVNGLHWMDIGANRAMHFLKDTKCKRWWMEFWIERGIFMWPCIEFLQFGSIKPSRGLSGPERALMSFQHVVDYCDVLWLWYFVSL